MGRKQQRRQQQQRDNIAMTCTSRQCSSLKPHLLVDVGFLVAQGGGRGAQVAHANGPPVSQVQSQRGPRVQAGPQALTVISCTRPWPGLVGMHCAAWRLGLHKCNPQPLVAATCHVCVYVCVCVHACARTCLRIPWKKLGGHKAGQHQCHAPSPCTEWALSSLPAGTFASLLRLR